MKLSTPLALVLVAFSVSSLLSQEAKPLGSDLDSALKPFVEDGTVAGLVAITADKNAILTQSVLGFSNVEAKLPMKSDSIFWIASMSKPVTGACVMMLVDEGKISLDDKIVKHLPEMSELVTEDGKRAEITIRHLLTHTSGMAELPAGEAYRDATLADVAAKYAHVKVLFEPGSKWQYSQTSINTAARIVEVVSGVSFDEFVESRVCKPLGMVDTTFYLSEEQLTRLATSYDTLEDGGFKEKAIGLLSGSSPTFRGRFPAANGGLFSTAADYTKFCQMLLNGGEFNGKRLLSTEAVTTMRTIATGDLQTGFTPGNGWGIGCCVIREPQGITESLSPGSFGHGGAYGTQAWIDPVKNRIHVLMVQRANFGNSDGSALRKALHDAGQ